MLRKKLVLYFVCSSVMKKRNYPGNSPIKIYLKELIFVK